MRCRWCSVTELTYTLSARTSGQKKARLRGLSALPMIRREGDQNRNEDRYGDDYSATKVKFPGASGAVASSGNTASCEKSEMLPAASCEATAKT